MVERILKAGYLDNNVFNETIKGTPQGGLLSPLLANIALHGMEDALNIKYKRRKRNRFLRRRGNTGIGHKKRRKSYFS